MSNLRDLLCAELKRQLEARSPVAPRIPAGGDLLWRWFMDLHRSRTLHAAGPNPIAYAEIVAYAALMRWPIEPRHVSVLRAMDQTYLEASMKPQAAAPEGVKTLPPISSAPVTAVLVDAMFG
ncbi:phage tail assembly chaperone [Agrobacterium radiobacter]|uniref:phage tail assembly chaperone n=1 Tax=Agrobacterium radiobacter TaxID=362 RepID=UPI003F84FE49